MYLLYASTIGLLIFRTSHTVAAVAAPQGPTGLGRGDTRVAQEGADQQRPCQARQTVGPGAGGNAVGIYGSHGPFPAKWVKDGETWPVFTMGFKDFSGLMDGDLSHGSEINRNPDPIAMLKPKKGSTLKVARSPLCFSVLVGYIPKN